MFNVGDKIGYQSVSDFYPCTVVGVSKSGKVVTVKDNQVGQNKKVWPEQDFEVFDTLAETWVREFSLRNNGRWVSTGTDKNGYPALTTEHRRYIDPHF